MKRILILLLVISPVVLNAQLTLENIAVEGTDRSYYRYLPSGYIPGENLPVVVVLHGIGDNALNMSNVGFNQMADTARFIPVYLQGKLNNYSQTSWNNGTLLASNVNDVLFISMVLDALEDSFDVDLSRVYLTGFSMGSIMCYKAASELSDRIAAIACFSGTMSTQQINATDQQYPVPTLHCHGTADAQVPYSGTPLPSLSLVEQTMTKNKSLNNWQGDSTIYNVPNNASDGITVEKIVYNTTTPLELWKLNNGGHIWMYQPVNDTSNIFIAWYFFMDKQHPNPSTAVVNPLKSDISLQVFPNPASDQVNISIELNAPEQMNITLMDVMGKEVDLVYSGKLNKGSNLISYELSDLPSGIYFLQLSGLETTQTIKLIHR